MVSREERKKQEKREKKDAEEETDRSVWVKYPLGLRHQVSFLLIIPNYCINFVED